MPPPPTLCTFITLFPLCMLHNLCHTLLSLLLLPPLPGITLVDKTSPVDEPSNSDQVTEGLQCAYTLPQQQSNQEDNDTAVVGVHPCVCVCTVCVGLCACALYGSVWGVCLVAQGERWRHESHLSEHTWTKGCSDS